MTAFNQESLQPFHQRAGGYGLEAPLAPGPGAGLNDHERYIKEWAANTDLTSADYDSMLELWRGYARFDPASASEVALDLSLGFAVAEEFNDFYRGCDEVNPGVVLASDIASDTGKEDLPELARKSREGREWTDDDAAAFEAHPRYSGRRAREAGLGPDIFRPVEEHHRRQLGRQYGVNEDMNWREATTRDIIGIADFAGAMMLRTNSRNRDMALLDRSRRIYTDIEWVLRSYSNSDMLVPRIHRRVMSEVQYLAQHTGRLVLAA